MNTHQITLQPYQGMSSRYTCPQCGHKHKFTRYIDVATGKHINDKVGRCDREDDCGYHYKPKQFFTDHPVRESQSHNWKLPEPKQLISSPVEYLPHTILEKSVLNHEQCNLYQFLFKLFREKVAKQLCERYFIGTNKNGDTAFWQVDFKAKIRQVKIIRYNPSTGKRTKEKPPYFAGKRLIGKDDANLQMCFFGEHLLSQAENTNKPVAIVESEKTAVIASVYYPAFVWLSTGGKHGCNWTQKSVCHVLEGRKVILFPDLGAYHCWSEKGSLLSKVAGCKVFIIDLLEKCADENEKKGGLDIADYLLKKQDESGLALTDRGYPVIWDYELNNSMPGLN
ncbi:MAG TPA: DUF6371 domain-containing protein [Ferruginibacter sp.]|nr:DUF6371 domain-containing protein [Ferruginibacter sp.]